MIRRLARAAALLAAAPAAASTVVAPSGYAGQISVAYGVVGGPATAVTPQTPLPVVDASNSTTASNTTGVAKDATVSSAAAQAHTDAGVLAKDATASTAATTAHADAASYTFAPPGGAAESSTAASYGFTAANVAVARAWYAVCPTGTVSSTNPIGVAVTVTGVNGGSRPVYLADGNNGEFAQRLASFAGNSAGCTIGLEF